MTKINNTGSEINDNDLFSRASGIDGDQAPTINNWLVAWSIAFRLEMLHRVKEWMDLE